MARITPFVSIFFIALFFIAPVSAGYITPTKENVTQAMLDYDLKGENNSLQLACEIGEYVSETYNWNCDIRQVNFSKHAPVYIDVFYPAADTARGHDGYYAWFGPQKKEVTGFWTKDKVMNYRDWGSKDSWCGLKGVCSYGIVKSYFGNDSEEVITDPVILPVNGSPVNESYCVIIPEDHDTERITVENYNNSTKTVENNVVNLTDNQISNSVENSTGTVNNQGIIEDLKQYFFDFKDAHLENVTFKFWGN